MIDWEQDYTGQPDTTGIESTSTVYFTCSSKSDEKVDTCSRVQVKGTLVISKLCTHVALAG